MPENEQLPEEIVEQVGQTALEQVVEQTPADKKSTPGGVAMGVAVAGAAAASQTGDTQPNSPEKPEGQNNDDKAKQADKRPSSLPKQNTSGSAQKDDQNSGKNPDDKKPGGQGEESKKKDSRWATANPIVKTLVIAGVAVVTLGLIIAFFNLFFGVVLMAIGSAAIIACVFLPIGVKKG